MPDQIPMPKTVRSYLEKEMFGKQIADFTIKEVLGAGNTAITYGAEDRYGHIWALKLVTRESYGDRPPFREVARFAQAVDKRFLVFPEETGDWELPHEKKNVQFIWFRSRCVRGKSLESFLQSVHSFSPLTEVRRFIENLVVALEQLKKIGFAHGDFHNRNIMREVVGEGGPVPEVQYVVIDFSEAHAVEDTDEGLLEDLEMFGQHLRSFADWIHRKDDISREDERVLKAIGHLPGLLNGLTAETLRLWNPTEILRTFQEGLRSAEEAPTKLRTPFDSLSAENITNDALLAKLCFTNNWWAAELEKPGNVLLVGPRGCGKSMIFRRHRLKTKIAAHRAKELKSDTYVGFYLPCESLFFNRISDLSSPIVQRYGDALLLFFNMAVTAECVSALSSVQDFLGPVTRSAAESLRELFEEETKELLTILNFAPGVVDVSDLADRSEHVMRWVRRAISYGEKIPARGSMDYVARLVDTIKQQVPALSQRLFIFFLDDYTEERVPLALQKILHPVVCQRSGDFCFKISAHMFGSMYSYPQPLALDEGRNINVINLGSEYINPKKKKAEREALITIMNTRFEQCEEYKGPIESWLGRSSYPGGKSLNRALHDPSSRDAVKYNGIECLQQLCTGDVSEMIRMVRDIFRLAGIQKGAPGKHPINPSIQDKAIRNVSRDFLSRVRHIRADGQKLYDILYAFGTLSKQLLYERAPVGQGKDSRGQQRKDPYDLLTIYVDDLTKANPEARRAWERLQQASIFVDILLAPSQRAVIADRVTLRKIYCPAFATTLTSSEHLQLTKDQFEWFMYEPGGFCGDYLRKVAGVSGEPTLWPGAEQPSKVAEEEEHPRSLPVQSDMHDFRQEAPADFTELTRSLPDIQVLENAISREMEFDLFISAVGFEERTYAAAARLVKHGVKAKRALLLEFDIYYQATERRRDNYESILASLTPGKSFRLINAPLATRDILFAERMKNAITSVAGPGKPRILFDCTSCPSLILSRCLAVLLELPCELTVVYSEAAEYYPTKTEWESGKLAGQRISVEGPFSGVRFVEKPPLLQSDDIRERPILLVGFPTFNTERTSGVLAELEPAKRIWIFGEPHDLAKNAYRIEMSKEFASPVVMPGDEWSLVSTFDYKASAETLAGIFARDRNQYRLVVMPHGSKMQTLGVNLFAATHQVSMVFAVPQTYDPNRYSQGCSEVWSIPLGDTESLLAKLKYGRVVVV